jgi:hypothetical protein
MEKMLLKYRSWYQGEPPRPIRLQIPGWSGEQNQHRNGDVPQPWHCIPFVEGSTYGLELFYAFDTECHVKMVEGEVKFFGDFSEESKKIPKSVTPPFSSFAPGHFGMTSCLDIEAPEDYILRIEPHPRFYTDETYTVPLAIPGHLNTSMWPKIFFVVFKNPMPGQTYIFRKNEPYAQIIILPRKMQYEIREMTSGESSARALLEDGIETLNKKFVKNSWFDYKGNNFDDKYKILNNIFTKEGKEGIRTFLKSVSNQNMEKCKIIKKKLFFPKKKNEIIQNKEKE